MGSRAILCDIVHNLFNCWNTQSRVNKQLFTNRSLLPLSDMPPLPALKQSQLLLSLLLHLISSLNLLYNSKCDSITKPVPDIVSKAHLSSFWLGAKATDPQKPSQLQQRESFVSPCALKLHVTVWIKLGVSCKDIIEFWATFRVTINFVNAQYLSICFLSIFQKNKTFDPSEFLTFLLRNWACI